MSKRTKIWLITAASLVAVGCIILGGVMSVFQWDFRKLSTINYETNRCEINEAFENISIDTKTADIVLVPSDSENASVVCYEQKNIKHSVTVQDGTLVIEVEDTRKWYEYIGIAFVSAPKITVAVPQGQYGTLSVKSSTGDVKLSEDFQFESMDIAVSTGDVKCLASASEHIKIKASTGDIRVENVSANALELSVSTGKVTVSHVTCQGDVQVKVSTGKAHITDTKCQNVISSGGTGDISLQNVIAAEKFEIKRSTGDVNFDGCDAAEISVKTDTGDVKGSLLSEKVFIVETDTGSINVPKTVTGGKCQITTDTGDIKIHIP